LSAVGLTRGDASYEAVRAALDLVRQDVRVPPNRPVLIKPNMVSSRRELAATPVDAVRATMDFLAELGVKRFIVGEATAGSGDTMGAFQRFGYLSLRDTHDVEFKDLNRDELIDLEVLDAELGPKTIRLARSYVTSWTVSVARMKTHNAVVVTLSIKNTAIGSIHNPDRHGVSHDPRPMNLSLVRLNQAACPALSVIDGVVGMEGGGPVDGTPIPSGVALAGTDPLAVDLVGTELMGFDPRTVGYLWYLGRLSGLSRGDIDVRGEDPAACITRYEAHETMARQLGWWVEDWRRYVDAGPRPRAELRLQPEERSLRTVA
jgi:uncharacterized protein (DUF362 family)